MSVFLCKLNVPIVGDKYISTTDFQGASHQYWGEVISPPKLTLAGKGYIQAKFGEMEIRHNPESKDAVFNYKDQSWPPTEKSFALEFGFGEGTPVLFKGTGIISDIEEDRIRIRLLETDDDLDLLEYVQDERRVTVDSLADVSSTLQVTATGHGFIDGAKVIFEGLTNEPELNYNSTEALVYKITTVTANTFVLSGLDPTDYTMGTEGNGKVGPAVVRPMAFGVITHIPIVKKSGILLTNPYLDTGQIIRFYDDAVESGNNIVSDPNEFTTIPTATEITIDFIVAGEGSLSGTGLNATNLSELFSYVCTKLSLTLNTAKAPNASTQKIAFYQGSQIKLKELLNQVAQAMGYQFFIDKANTTLYLIDRLNQPSSIGTFSDIIRFDVREPHPVSRTESNWTTRVPYTGTTKRLEVKQETAFANSSRFTSGNPHSVPAFLRDDVEMHKVLANIMSTEEKTFFEITIPKVDTTTVPGDRFKHDDENRLLAYDLVITGIKDRDYLRERTSFTARGTKTIIVYS